MSTKVAKPEKPSKRLAKLKVKKIGQKL